ncbi:hypothetical protein [Cupriavidus pauculus]|uniref:hypothetical protein n=1 Tax=Cupriavidus pauculus TaxID=82633 RepID=UPI000A99A775|nr:hypothetical protein [Cupriavidus pauculus]
MSASLSTDELLIENLQAHLRAEGYSLRIQRWYPARVRQLLDYCDRNGLSIEAVRSGHVTRFWGHAKIRPIRYHKSSSYDEM